MNDYGTSPNETAAIFKIADPSQFENGEGSSKNMELMPFSKTSD